MRRKSAVTITRVLGLGLAVEGSGIAATKARCASPVRKTTSIYAEEGF